MQEQYNMRYTAIRKCSVSSEMVNLLLSIRTGNAKRTECKRPNSSWICGTNSQKLEEQNNNVIECNTWAIQGHIPRYDHKKGKESLHHTCYSICDRQFYSNCNQFAIRYAILMVRVSIGRMGLWSGNPLLSWNSYCSTTHCEIWEDGRKHGKRRSRRFACLT